jgi:hypothetical protein
VETRIRYLELVRGDLAEAARRQAQPAGHRLSFAPRTRGRVIAAATAATLTLAGLVGWLAIGDRLPVVRRGLSELGGSTGGAGATGATGAPVPATPPVYGPVFGGGAGADSDLVTTERIIRTAGVSLVIPKDSFEDRFSQAVEIASSNGGFVSSSTTRARSGDLRIRVPADNFDETLRALRALGDVKVQTIEGQDVTADYVDLEARLQIAESRREVLLRLMDEAKSVGQTIHVQNALDETQLRIEELQGQIRMLDDQVTLASIRLQLAEEGAGPNQDATASTNMFERSLDGFVGVVSAMVVGLGFLLPIALLGVVVWFVASRIRRRRAA